jgi:hypothetical protein
MNSAKILRTLRNDAVISDKFQPKHIDYLFKRLGALYGNTWLRRDDNWAMTRQEWSNSLSNFQFETVMIAMNDLRTSGSKFPPSLPEFVSLCVKHKPRNYWKPPVDEKVYEPSPLLAKYMAENPEAISTESINKAKYWLDVIRNKLNLKRHDVEVENKSILRQKI